LKTDFDRSFSTTSPHVPAPPVIHSVQYLAVTQVMVLFALNWCRFSQLEIHQAAKTAFFAEQVRKLLTINDTVRQIFRINGTV